jgi:hypothetical protein
MKADLSKVNDRIIECMVNMRSSRVRDCPITHGASDTHKCDPCHAIFGSFTKRDGGDNECPCKALDPEYVRNTCDKIIEIWNKDKCAKGTYKLEDPSK